MRFQQEPLSPHQGLWDSPWPENQQNSYGLNAKPTVDNNTKSPLARCEQKMWPGGHRHQSRAGMMSAWHSMQMTPFACLTVVRRTWSRKVAGWAGWEWSRSAPWLSLWPKQAPWLLEFLRLEVKMHSRGALLQGSVSFFKDIWLYD